MNAIVWWVLTTMLLAPVDDELLARKTRIVLPEVRKAFYRSGGRHLVGRQVYLQLEASVLRKEPRRIGRPGGRISLVFENRSVPVVVSTQNPYWIKVSRHLDDATWFSVRGCLRIPEHDPRGRVHLYVESIKHTPGR